MEILCLSGFICGLMRIKAVISYDGTAYYGWQIQKNLPTIQSTMEGALKRICDQDLRVTGAGRTDTGVHAYAQVAHFDWNHHLAGDKLLLAVNAMLPSDIRVLSVEETRPDFHARFDAKSKMYVYRIDLNRVYNPFTYRYALFYPFPLDLDLMQQCAQTIEGKHDFAGFQATGTDVVETVRTVFRVEVLRQELLLVRIHATGFLRKMVRFLVGTMLEISGNRRPIADLEFALKTQDRKYVGVPAAARGLFLEKVLYDI